MATGFQEKMEFDLREPHQADIERFGFRRMADNEEVTHKHPATAACGSFPLTRSKAGAGKSRAAAAFRCHAGLPITGEFQKKRNCAECDRAGAVLDDADSGVVCLLISGARTDGSCTSGQFRELYEAVQNRLETKFSGSLQDLQIFVLDEAMSAVQAWKRHTKEAHEGVTRKRHTK
jgi:hypothetical protein